MDLYTAVFLYKWAKKDNTITNFIAAALSLLPFLFVFAAYWFDAKNFLYSIPADIIVSSKSFAAIVNPFAFSIDTVSIGFFHAPFGALWSAWSCSSRLADSGQPFFWHWLFSLPFTSRF